MQRYPKRKPETQETEGKFTSVGVFWRLQVQQRVSRDHGHRVGTRDPARRQQVASWTALLASVGRLVDGRGHQETAPACPRVLVLGLVSEQKVTAGSDETVAMSPQLYLQLLPESSKGSLRAKGRNCK